MCLTSWTRFDFSRSTLLFRFWLPCVTTAARAVKGRQGQSDRNFPDRTSFFDPFTEEGQQT